MWLALDKLYGRYYVVMRGGVFRGRLEANTEADTDGEGEGREGGNVGDYK